MENFQSFPWLNLPLRKYSLKIFRSPKAAPQLRVAKSCEDKRPSMSSIAQGMCHNIFMIVSSMFATTTEGPICRTIRFLTVTHCFKLAAPSLQVSLIVAGSPRHTKYPFFHNCQSTPSRYRNHRTTF